MGRSRSGSVYEKPAGSGKWWYSLYLRDGARWTKPVPARPDGAAITEAHARAFKEECLRRYVAGTWDPQAPKPAPPAPMPTVEAYGAVWAAGLVHLRSNFNARMLELHLDGTDLGAMPLDRVEPKDVAAWVKELRVKPVEGGGVRAPNTIRGIYGVVKRLFAHALFERRITFTPCVMLRGILPPQRDKVPGARRTWRFQREEIVELLSDVRLPLDRRVVYAILFLSGARVSEMIVLRWKDYDPSRTPLGCLTLARAWKKIQRPGATKAKVEWVEDATKTETVKEIPVHVTLAGVLAEWKLGGWARHCGRAPGDEDLIAPTFTLQRRNRRNVYKQLQDDCTTVGVRARRVHGTRHTFISLAMDDGVRADVFSKLTHPAPDKADGTSALYREATWRTLCAEVSKIQLARRPDVLPLWRAVAVGQSDTATDTATTPDIARGMGAVSSGSLSTSVFTP